MKWFLLLLSIVLLFVGGAAFQAQFTRWEALGGERVVAALPGVGQGWLDTLRRVAGPVSVDTLSKQEIGSYDDGDVDNSSMLGLYEPWHRSIYIRADMLAFAFYIRRESGQPNPSHPFTSSNPAGVVAHEFGHAFQSSLWPHGEVREAGDSLPSWAQDEREHFADRFARAMLALRGWDYPDPDDSTLNKTVRALLTKSLQGGKQ